MCVSEPCALATDSSDILVSQVCNSEVELYMQNVDYEASVLSTCYVITPLMPHDFVLFFYLISYLCRFLFKYDFINSFMGNLQCACRNNMGYDC